LYERPPDATEPLVPSPHLLASIAPAAPTQRYAFGGLDHVPLRRERRWLIPLLVGTGSGVIIGSVGIGMLASRRQPAPTIATSAPTFAPSAASTLASFAQKPPLQSSLDAGEIELDPSALPPAPSAEPVPIVRPRPTAPAGWVHRTAPIGTMHDGFTKLR